MRGFKLKQFEH